MTGWPFSISLQRSYSGDMLYRPFRSGDFEALYAIEKICFQPPLRFGRLFMRSLIDAPNSETWIAEEDGNMAGFAVADWARGKKETVAYLQTIEVVPPRRGRGVASELLRRIEGAALAAGASALWLHVDAKNANAIRLYEKHGYAFHGERDHYYGPDRGALIYRKALQEEDASRTRTL